MPIIVPNDLPSADQLHAAGIPLVGADAALRQEIRPLRIVLVNLDARRLDGDVLLARMLANSPIQVELALLSPPKEGEDLAAHLLQFYRSASQILAATYDGLVVTGGDDREGGVAAHGLADLLAWSATGVGSSLFIGAAAAAVFSYRYGIAERPLPQRRLAVVRHRVEVGGTPLVHGLDRSVDVPVIRHGEFRRADLRDHPGCAVLADSEEAGLHLVLDAGARRAFVFNRLDADAEGLARARRRDGQAAIESGPQVLRGWRSHAHLLLANWLHHEVYQRTVA